MEEDTPLKIIQIYFAIKVIFIGVGIILFFLNIPHLSYLNFLFENQTLYNVSIIIPIILLIGYFYCIRGLAERSNLAEL